MATGFSNAEDVCWKWALPPGLRGIVALLFPLVALAMVVGLGTLFGWF